MKNKDTPFSLNSQPLFGWPQVPMGTSRKAAVTHQVSDLIDFWVIKIKKAYDALRT